MKSDYCCDKCGYTGDSVELTFEDSEYNRLCSECEREEREEESREEIANRENAVLDFQERSYMRREW